MPYFSRQLDAVARVFWISREDFELGGSARWSLQRYRLAAALLLILKLAIIWLIPVLPCQDLPQHLAYARILRDFGNPDLPFHNWYALPARLLPYFTTHLALAWLGHHMPMIVALKVVLSFYVVGFSLSFQYLTPAIYPERSASAPVQILENVLVFNPVFCLGLLPFLLCLPLCFLGWGIGLRQRLKFSWTRELGLFLVSCLIVSIHPLSLACLALFLIIHLLIAPSWSNIFSTATALAGGGGTLALWRRFGELGLGTVDWSRLAESARQSIGLDVLTHVLRATWQDPPMTLNYATWTIFGPYRWNGLLLSAAAVLAVAWIARRGPRSQDPDQSSISAQFRRSAAVFAVLSLLAPWGIQSPSEATFINLRLMTLAWGLLLVAVAGAASSPCRPSVAVIGLSAFAVLHFGARAYFFSKEAAPVLELVSSARPLGLMSSWVFHDRSNEFAKQFRVTHFLPMYYTVLAGGVNMQFWARYVEHLPIDYRPGVKLPPVARDRNPREVSEVELQNVDWVLIQMPNEEDSKSAQIAGQRALALLEKRGDRVDCRGLWCLYKTRRSK